MLKNNLSVCLAVYNEEKNLDRCLQSVKGLAGEIIIVDGSSTDKTINIAKKHKAKIFKTSNKFIFHINKQMAIDKAKNEWILLLDADEEVDKELKKEIQSVISHQSLIINGYWIPRKNIIFGKWIEHTGWWPDYQLRLFKSGKAAFPCQSIHEDPVLKGKSGKLKNPLYHYHYQTISQYLRRLDLYTENDKRIWLKEGRKINWQQAITMPVEEFTKRFLAWKGYKDGLHGLVLSILQSFYQFIVFAKVWEEKGFRELEIDSIDKTRVILKEKLKEFDWWQMESKIKNQNSKFKKIYYKLIRKLKAG